MLPTEINPGIVVLDLTVGDNDFEFAQSISMALSDADAALLEIEERIIESECFVSRC